MSIAAAASSPMGSVSVPRRRSVRLVLLLAVAALALLLVRAGSDDSAAPGSSAPSVLPAPSSRQLSMDQYRSIAARGAGSRMLALEPAVVAEGVAASGTEWRVEAATVSDGHRCVVFLKTGRGGGAAGGGCAYALPLDWGSTPMADGTELVFGLVTAEATTIEIVLADRSISTAAVAPAQLTGAKAFGATVPLGTLRVRALSESGRVVAEARH